MVKDYSVKEETPLLPHVLLFPVSCNGSFISMPIIDPLSYFLFQPVLHDWCNKGCGIMCYPVCGMVCIKEHLLLIGNSSPCNCSSRFLQDS